VDDLVGDARPVRQAAFEQITRNTDAISRSLGAVARKLWIGFGLWLDRAA
jgi:hypothetical protein